MKNNSSRKFGLSPADIIAALRETLPATFCRTQIDKLFGGLICSGTQRNLDSAGHGPECFRMGRKVAYTKDTYLEWFKEYLTKRWVDAPLFDSSTHQDS